MSIVDVRRRGKLVGVSALRPEMSGVSGVMSIADGGGRAREALRAAGSAGGRGSCGGALSMRVRAQSRAPRVRFSRPGDSGGALHNCVAALRARPRSERPPRARNPRRYAQRRALYVTRDHRAHSRSSPPYRGFLLE